VALESGTRLGAYEIQSPLGAGGMGEVYKARDTRLERTVAIKVLPPHWAGSPEMRQRFEREAQAIAALNHPHICTLHDIGHEAASPGEPAIDFLVMEYLDGETLAARLERGPLAVDEALQVAIHVADALDKAHRHGVVHRDLKPGNVFLVRGGSPSDPTIAKLLDFGLARLGPDQGRAPSTPTPAAGQLTTPGAILGTLQYMAPEQLEGADADARSDIFAFGTVVHEMITGRKTFEGQSRVLLMSAIATKEPAPLTEARPGVPRALEHIVSACLAKSPDARWQSARDLLAALQLVAEGHADASAGAQAPSPRARRLAPVLLGAGFVAVAAASFAAAGYIRGSDDTGEIRLRVPIGSTAEPLQVTSANYRPIENALSVDGRTLAFVARPDTDWSLFVRPLGSVSPTRLAPAAENAMPFWSPDGKWIGFIAGGRLQKVEASGGPAQDLCPVTDFAGGTWNADGTIVFGSSKGLFEVSDQGGTPAVLTTASSAGGGHLWPHFLPDGRRYLYLAWSSQPAERAIVAGELGSKQSTRVMPLESRATFVEPGYLVFIRESAAYARRFDPKALSVSGEPIRIADNVVGIALTGRTAFTSSPNGVLAYMHAAQQIDVQTEDTIPWQLLWMSRAGELIEAVGRSGTYRGAEVSPDGTRIAVHRHEAAGGNVLILEPKGAITPLTFDASRDNSNPIWSPGGDRVVYSAVVNGKWGLYEKPSNGSGVEKRLYESDHPLAPYSWSPDGKQIVFGVQDPKTGSDLWVYAFDGDGKPSPIVATNEYESAGQISRDGRWLAYVATLNGRREIFVRPFPTGVDRWQVSTDGGDSPRWGVLDRELYFHGTTMADNGLLATLLSSVVKTNGAVFEREQPTPILSVPAFRVPHPSGDYPMYAVHPKGRGFLITAGATFNAGGGRGGVVVSSPDPVETLVVAKGWVGRLK
jgi:Tol biopolymer transport system component